MITLTHNDIMILNSAELLVVKPGDSKDLVDLLTKIRKAGKLTK